MSTDTQYAPFLDGASFEREVEELPPPAPVASASWSPFLSVYEGAEGEADGDEPAREAYAAIVAELHDEEFEESLYELLADARSLHQDHLASGHSLADADRIVTQHFANLAHEAEAMLATMAREFGTREDPLVANELESFAERYAPATSLEPPFQDFLGKLVKKVAKGARAVAGKAIKAAAKFALGPVLNRIMPLVRPLLNRVLQAAIGRLPAAVQPMARQLAQRLGLVAPPKPAPAAPATPTVPVPAATAADAAAEPAAPAEPAAADAGAAPEAAGSPVQASAAPDVAEMQLEFDELLAEALLADDEVELELEMARVRAATSAPGDPVFVNLDQARERFIHDLEQLREGESPAPYVESFLPAVLPALRIAIRLAGRPRVVSFLAGLLGKLIAKLVGPANAPALSRAITDAGLKLLSLELSADDEARLATSAVAATVEETVARVASLPDHVLDDEELLEGFALEAFEQAAAANLPALFSEATYRRRPALLEGGLDAAWLAFPLRRPRYKRCSRTFTVTLAPHAAEAVRSFDDAPLAEVLQDQLGLPEGEDVEAEVHLYELLPGGTAADVARGEHGVPGLGAADEAALSQLHPLTEEAAGVLLGKPALGRPLPAGARIRTALPGQRLYHLAIRGRAPLTVLAGGGRRRVRRLTRLTVVLDVPRDQIRVCVFFSEVKAQRLAVRLRQQTHAGSLTVGFTKLLATRLPHVLQGRRGRRLRLVHPALPPGPASAAMLRKLPALVPPGFVAALQGWLAQAFADFVKTKAQAFLAASQDPSDGVTLVFTIDQPPGLKALGAALAGGAPAGGAAAAVATTSTPAIRVEAVPGHRCD